MNPCRQYRKAILSRSIGSLPAKAAGPLQRHLDHCEGCRRYAEEMRQLTGRLNGLARKMDIEPSAGFHDGWVRKLTSSRETAPAGWSKLRERLAAFAAARKPAVAAAAFGLLLVLLSSFFVWPRSGPLRNSSNSARHLTPPASSDPEAELAPTLANYYSAASQSLDSFDRFLAQQTRELQPPHPPPLTPSLLGLDRASEY